MAFTQEKNTYARIWGLKKGEGICPKGAHFRELIVCVCERETRGGMREMTGVCGACNCSHILGLH